MSDPKSTPADNVPTFTTPFTLVSAGIVEMFLSMLLINFKEALELSTS
jgi:hypothetical protein